MVWFELIHLAHDQNKYVCLIGDYNARIGNSPDLVTPDVFLLGGENSRIFLRMELECF